MIAKSFARICLILLISSTILWICVSARQEKVPTENGCWTSGVWSQIFLWSLENPWNPRQSLKSSTILWICVSARQEKVPTENGCWTSGVWSQIFLWYHFARKSLKSSTILWICVIARQGKCSNGKWLLVSNCLKPKIVPLKIPLLEMVEKLSVLWKSPRQFSVTQMPWKMKSLNI